MILFMSTLQVNFNLLPGKCKLNLGEREKKWKAGTFNIHTLITTLGNYQNCILSQQQLFFKVLLLTFYKSNRVSICLVVCVCVCSVKSRLSLNRYGFFLKAEVTLRFILGEFTPLLVDSTNIECGSTVGK